MSKLNNENIKDLLSKTTVDMNLEMEWDAITAKMDAKKRNRKGIWWLFGTFLLLLTGSLLWSINNENTISFANESNELNTNQLQAENNEIKNSKELMDHQVSYETPQLISNTLEEISFGKNIEPSAVSSKKYSNEQEIKNNTKPTHRKTGPRQKLSDTVSSGFYQIEYTETATNINEVSSIKTILTEDLDKSLKIKNRSLELSIADIDILTNSIISNPRSLTTPNYSFIEPIKKTLFPKSYLYIDFSLLSSTNSATATTDNEYRKLINSGYSTLSKVTSNLGYGKFINSQWRVNLGISYNQYRSVYRGERIRMETTQVLKDTATVYVNNIGGTVYQAGQIEKTTTTTADIQQFSYLHSLGLNIGTRYNFYGPLYIGGDIQWNPIQWQSGMMINSDQDITSLNELITNTGKLQLGIDIGLNLSLTEHLDLETGLRYEPRQHSATFDKVNISSSSIGGQVRLSYRL